jgi:predicted Na+-dependent transporter
VLVFCTGSSITFAEFGKGRYALRRMLLVLAATTVVLPVLAWLASRLVSAPPLRGGVLAAGVAPAEVASVALTGLAGGEIVVAAVLLIASTLLTVLLAGPILSLLGGHSAISPLALLSTLALVVALPLIVGVTIRTIDPFGGRGRSLVDVLAVASLLVLLWEIASQLRLHAAYGVVAAALLAFLAAAGAVGWLLALGASAGQRVAVVLPTAMRDFAVAAGIAASAFGVAAAAPLGIYGVMVLAFGAVAVRLSKRRLSRSEDGTGATTGDCLG